MENKTKDAGTAKIEIDGKTYDMPVLSGTHGPNVVDVRKFYAQSGQFTFDPGFTSTASCESQITFINGEEGVLLHRGYPIGQLAAQATFPEVCYLILNGELPSKSELSTFNDEIKQHTLLHTQLDRFFDGFRRDSHPMAMLTGTVGAMASFYPGAMDSEDPEERRLASIRLIAKMPTLCARILKYNLGQKFVDPRNDLSYAENFLNMCFSVTAEDYKVDPKIAKAMDRFFILHADHEQNASTSTVRLAGSSGAHPFAAVAAGVACLWGPSHGGANEACLNMLHEIGTVDRIPEFIEKAKDKSDPFRLMGFGHRVYKNFDPRAKVMKQAADEVLAELGIEDENLEIAKRLEEIALQDEYFIEKKLYPNVDFYSGIILKALGIPTSMFTVIFAIGRTVGWIAHWNEMIGGAYRIGRPRQLYTGETQRDFIPVDKR